ncbi:MAG: histidine ammonia-lyase, partial [Phycisphaerales bacterium]|nr:histidine ammonia-lyase [Phycisphaerales bacterium]
MNEITLCPTIALTPQLVEAVARTKCTVALSAEGQSRITTSRARLESILGDGLAHYGINTGFGSLSQTQIARDELEDLQRNLIRSHAAGVGDPLDTDVVRAMMFILAASLSRGYSGVRLETVEQILQLLNNNITPIVPESGSVGASGDLAPLAHVALVLMGEGQAQYNGSTISGAEALSKAGIKPITLEAKEGLALINGTHLMTGRFALITQDLTRTLHAAIIANAMTIDAARASHGYLDPRIYKVRNQPGATRVARTLRTLLGDSSIVESHAVDDPRVQDPYSFRCSPLVLGSVIDAVDSCVARVHDELNAVTDNPLIFGVDGSDTPDIVSAGCFHGMPVALPMDMLAISVSHLAGIAERRLYHMLSAFDEQANLTPFMSPKPGVMSGFMIVQYAAAAMCNELIGLANPASVANISTCAGMEDYNSFGPRSAAKLARAVKLARSVIATELLCSAEGIEAHRPHRSGVAVENAVTVIRSVVPPLTQDRSPSPDIAAIEQLIHSGAFHSPLWDERLN